MMQEAGVAETLKETLPVHRPDLRHPQPAQAAGASVPCTISEKQPVVEVFDGEGVIAEGLPVRRASGLPPSST